MGYESGDLVVGRLPPVVVREDVGAVDRRGEVQKWGLELLNIGEGG